MTPQAFMYDTYVGRRLVIPCKATGIPQPKLTWTKRNSSLIKIPMPKSVKLERSRDSLDLVFDKVSRMHDGIYICEAVNQRGVGSSFAGVTVHCKYI